MARQHMKKMFLDCICILTFSSMVFATTGVTSQRCPGLSQCKCSRNIDLPIRDKKKYVFDALKCTGEFDLRTANYNRLKKDTIRRFELRNSTQNHLYANAFGDLQLESVSIRDQIVKFNEKAFDSISKSIRTLDLQNVNISRTWNLGFLRPLTDLETLNLDRNGKYPERLPDFVFSKLNVTSLKQLSLRECGIAVLAEKTLAGLPNLETLDLSNNHLHSIPQTILLLNNLRKVNLSHNGRLIFVREQAFRTLQKLEEIDISNTGIDTIFEHAFDGLENSLQIIKLHHAKIEHGYFGTMRSLRKLKTLDISYNRITEMHNTSFIGFSSLEELDISGQRKRQLSIDFSDNVFRGLERKLKVLRIRDLLMMSLPLAALSSMRYLQELDASNNNFSQVYESFFYGIKARTINLENSNISDIEDEAFETLKPGMNINFDHNNISNVSFILQTPICQFMKLSFVSNPVMCNCDVIEIVSTNRVPDIVGKCADALYRDEDLQFVHELPIARNVCDTEQFHNISRCSYILPNDSTTLTVNILLLGFLLFMTVK